MENFTNVVLLPENLPEVLQEDFNPLNSSYLKITYIRISIFALVLAGGLTSFLLFSDNKIPTIVLIAIIAVLLILIVYSVIISKLGFPKKGYLLREKDISYKTGLIFYKHISVTFNRIQHVEISQGILAKMFGLSSVKIFTAGGSASDLSIPGLLTVDAQKLKAFISEKISRYE
jgi:membrane protein YdbS with pleckstrin-like domain